MCTVYETVAEQQAATMAFLRIGIERSEKGVYVADAGGEDRARSVMRAHGIDVERALASDALLVTTSDRAYLHRGVFEPERMWAFWKDAARLARQQGFGSARCIGETDWLARGAPGVERWKEYESRLGDVALECRCSILCSYNRRLPSRMIRDAIRSHSLVVYRGALCRSMYYEPADVPGPERRERDVDRMLQHIVSHEVVEEELRRAYARNTEILESITDAFTAFDRDWRFVYVNQRAVQLLGKPRQELIGRVVWELFTEGIGMDHYHKFQKAMNERVPLVFDGYSPSSGRWYANHVYPTPDGLACYWSDITEIRRAQDELRRGAAYLAEGQRISHTGSWAWNVASGEIFWSLEHFRICGLDPAAFKPHIETAPRIIHPDDLPAARQAFDEATRERRDFAWQFRVLRPDGTIRHVRSVGHPVFDSAGELTEYVGTIADITEQKQAEEAVNAARAELAHVNRALTMGEFAASIAHELNQPLAAIVTNAEPARAGLGSAPPNTGEAADSLRRHRPRRGRAPSEVIVRTRELLARRQSQKAELRHRGCDPRRGAPDRAARRGRRRCRSTSRLPSKGCPP